MVDPAPAPDQPKQQAYGIKVYSNFPVCSRQSDV